MSKVVIAGSRDFFDEEIVFNGIERSLRLFRTYPTEVFSGKAKGVDRIGELWAYKNNIPIKPFPAAWKTHGPAAGPIRNAQMAFFCDYGIVFIDNDAPNGSPGSKGMARLLAQHKKRNMVFHIKDQKVSAVYLDGAYIDNNDVVNNTLFFS